MLDSVLVANRGEIARRVIRTARTMGIRTIAVHSDPDAQAPFVREADQAVRIGPAQPADSYLNVEALLRAARETRAEAVHPGYGFVSENADFARSCRRGGDGLRRPASGLDGQDEGQEPGPEPRPGRRRPGGSGQQGARGGRRHGSGTAAERIGYPVLLKAAGGGGGIGMAVAGDESRPAGGVRDRPARAERCFGSPASASGVRRALLRPARRGADPRRRPSAPSRSWSGSAASSAVTRRWWKRRAARSFWGKNPQLRGR